MKRTETYNGHSHIEFEVGDRVIVDVSRHDDRRNWESDYFPQWGHGDEYQPAKVIEVHPQYGLSASNRTKIKVELVKTDDGKPIQFWTDTAHATYYGIGHKAA